MSLDYKINMRVWCSSFIIWEEKFHKEKREWLQGMKEEGMILSNVSEINEVCYLNYFIHLSIWPFEAMRILGSEAGFLEKNSKIQVPFKWCDSHCHFLSGCFNSRPTVNVQSECRSKIGFKFYINAHFSECLTCLSLYILVQYWWNPTISWAISALPSGIGFLASKWSASKAVGANLPM